VFVQSRGYDSRVLHLERHDPRSAARLTGRHEREGGYRRYPLDKPPRERVDACCDSAESDLVQQLQTRIHSNHVLIWDGRYLESTCVVRVCEVIFQHVGKILRTTHTEPAHGTRLQHLNQLSPHVAKAGPPGRQQPLLRTARKNVDMACVYVQQGGSHALNGVHHEPYLAVPAHRSDCRKVGAIAGHERHPRYRNDGDVSTIEPGWQRIPIRESIRQQTQLLVPCSASALDRHPWIHVGGELSVVSEDHLVPRDWQHLRGDVQPCARIGNQRDLIPVRADQGSA